MLYAVPGRIKKVANTVMEIVKTQKWFRRDNARDWFGNRFQKTRPFLGTAAFWQPAQRICLPRCSNLEYLLGFAQFLQGTIDRQNSSTAYWRRISMCKVKLYCLTVPETVMRHCIGVLLSTGYCRTMARAKANSVDPRQNCFAILITLRPAFQVRQAVKQTGCLYQWMIHK